MQQTVNISTHPLILHKLTLLRNKATGASQFRQLLYQLSQMLFIEASADLPTEIDIVETPLTTCSGSRIAATVGLVPILRAGLGMAEAIQDLLPDAQVWHLGLYRDHQTHQPVTYYNKLPAKPPIDICYVIDPMLATGGSAVAAVNILKKWGLTKLSFIGIIAAPEGVTALQTAHPDVPIFLAALDSHLDERAYIVPGLGDAGDRQFGTMA